MKINTVDEHRIHRLNNVTLMGGGDIIYLMQREQRLDDNWSFLYALELAGKIDKKVQVVFVFTEMHHHLSLRSLDFLVKGLQEVEQRAAELGISFKVFQNDDSFDAIKSCCGEKDLSAVICDFNPLRISLSENKRLADSFDIPVIEVDSHNIVPCRTASPKQEYGAYTIRKKIEAVLPRYLTPYPCLEDMLNAINYKKGNDGININWDSIMTSLTIDNSVGPVETVYPGYKAGMKKMHGFIEAGLGEYDSKRNDPTLSGQSGLSAHFHFGQISAQTAAFYAARALGALPLKGGFLDEIIVRRELSDNFCLYNFNYDSFEGFPSWAKQSLNIHGFDKREYLYDVNELETAATHDKLWNAAQLQMTKTGIMHGYMRMYWAKKILEWSPDSAEAMKRAVYLNDKYSLDGKDPNGYAGCAWSIGGLHDRAWGDRPVFGKVRYMNEKGCRRKFDVDLYIRQQEVNS